MSTGSQFFAATEEGLAVVLDHVDARARELGLAQDISLKLRLIVEELFVNTVRHGRGAGPVTVLLERAAECVRLRYEDAGAEFNPFIQPDNSQRGESVAQRPVGRLGVVLIKEFAQSLDYLRLPGRNRIVVTLLLKPAA